MIVKLLTEHLLECLSLTRGCTGLSESTHVKMPHCWKSHVTAQIYNKNILKLCSQSALYLNNVEGHIDTSEVIYTAVPAS